MDGSMKPSEMNSRILLDPFSFVITVMEMLSQTLVKLFSRKIRQSEINLRMFKKNQTLHIVPKDKTSCCVYLELAMIIL